ncbi:MAG: hypothetical protein COX77_00240 [Candidatus Komeilibacteria bacterium CG_4_10_14_0_2_um_filter_37_10]|uniref:tetrahydrofolate synthase n=1 Tax=Candidatus Komeilibacteria bacterium CG_4_10_14_0_2_um_filter_37_10 TaxID=1974470 RepID=A0A2M7VGP4_9BACT|nr:MAG: hypothetical protein COX77_00240 [Candidatus Komeilibacteria bacterium CG_4_10_14_0_2_um_filter_37_10]
MNKRQLNHYRQAIKYLESFSGGHIKDYINSPEKLYCFADFLSHFDHPERKINFIHVAGTSGKGSVCSYINNGLQKSNKKIGLYISPHLNTAIERISINNEYIAPQQFLHYYRKIKKIIDQGVKPPSYLGLLLTIGFLYWSEMKCDYVVLETNVGGGNDFTNIIPAPVASVITNIGLDHQKLLGNSLSSIAHHKAGIIKGGSAFFTGENRQQILKIFTQQCQLHKVPMTVVRSSNKYFASQNIALAKEVIYYLTNRWIKTIINCSLPARQEIVQTNPLIMIDGAHNPDKVKALVANIKKNKIKPTFLIIGFSGNKNWPLMLKLLAPLAANIICTRSLLAPHAAQNPQIIATLAQKINRRAKVSYFWDNQTALRFLLTNCHRHNTAIITGSLYLAGEIRTHWFDEKYILTHRTSFKV